MKALITHNNKSDRFSLAKTNTSFSDIEGELIVKTNDKGINIIVIKWAKDNKEHLVYDGEQYFHNMHFRFTKALQERFNAMLNLVHDTNESLTNCLPSSDKVTSSVNSQTKHKGSEVKTTQDTNVNPLKVATKQAKITTPKKTVKKPKEVTKADTTTEAKSIHTKLNNITEDKAVIKAKYESINANVKEVIPMITEYVKKLREEDKVYKDAKKTTLVKLVKARLASKEHVVNTVCDVMILGLNIDNTISLSSMAFIVKCVNNGTFSKAKVNKADKTTLESMVTAQHKANRLAMAKKLIG